jgi:peptidoglycan/LPS O-acetylase OafA/YrhL
MQGYAGLVRIAGFDGVRAIAVTFVFIAHRVHLEGAGGLGFWGVSAFFCLSGYLITLILHGYRREIEAGEATGRSQLGRFLVRRSLRIFPIFYLTLAAVGLVSLLVPDQKALSQGLHWHALYLSNIYISLRGEFVGHLSHLWSLAAEEQFYLAFAPLLLFTPSRWHARICAGVIATGLCALAALLWLRAPGPVLYTFPLISFGLLATGGLAALEGENWLSRAWLRRLLAAAGVGAALMILLPLVGFRGDWRGLDFLVAGLAGAGLMLTLHRGAWDWPRLLLSHPVLEWLGRRSYALYLYNFIYCWPVAAAFWRITGVDAPDRLRRATEVVIDGGVLILLAAVSWITVERPLLRLKDRDLRSSWAQRLLQPRGMRSGL